MMSAAESDRRRSAVEVPVAIQPVLLLTPTGPTVLVAEHVTPDEVGLKAYGLAALPKQWSLPFFVIDGATEFDQLSLDQIGRAVQVSGLEEAARLIIRSSGTSESLETRGQLVSAFCRPDQLKEQLLELVSKLPQNHGGRVHWIVQEYHEPRRQGHFSNERRLSHDKRDWRLEVEPLDGYAASATSLNVRQWRDGKPGQAVRLTCRTERDVKKELRKVAIWGTGFGCRLHFEWVWDGQDLWIVQLDMEIHAQGVSPNYVLSCKVESVGSNGLQVFQVATAGHYANIRKLKNVALYAQLGYSICTFYVLDSPEEIVSILAGTPSPELAADLHILTQRPLIIRTDGSNVPLDKREMLPRSEELRSGEEAVRWLVEDFSVKVARSGISQAGLVLICHHFIPSAASAWARAEPRSPLVRVEALWGIPEGLYWHPHDTYEIDVGDSVIGRPLGVGRLKITKRIRWKGVFVGPDEAGKWVYQRTRRPWDWKETVAERDWLCEIARVSKLIAQELGEPTSVMWFIDNHPGATNHVVLPWHHERSERIAVKAVPQRKFRNSLDYTIRTRDDIARLKVVGVTDKIERVRVQPTDHSLIRDPEFAKELALQSKQRGFVIELAGGVLSHIYYILQRAGARVECVDLFGEAEERAEFYKIVRDSIPELIEKRGESAHVVTLTGDARLVGLRQKLIEEACEVLDASSTEEIVCELADVLEVIRAISNELGVSTSTVEAVRRGKKKAKGGFEKGYMLTVTETPQSLHGADSEQEGLAAEDRGSAHSVVSTESTAISIPSLIPTGPVVRRPDLRHITEFGFEKLLSIEAGIGRLNYEVRESLDFELPGVPDRVDEFVFSVSLRREGSSIRSVVRLRREEQQLRLPLDEVISS